MAHQLFGPVLALYLAVKVGSRTFVTLDWLERHQDFGKKTSPKETGFSQLQPFQNAVHICQLLK